MTLLKELMEGRMKSAFPTVSGEREGATPKVDFSVKDEKPKASGWQTRVQNLAKRANVEPKVVADLYHHEKSQNTSFQSIWANVERKLKLREAEEDEDDDDNAAYHREKKVETLILKAFRKCGIDVAEMEGSFGGAREEHDRYGYDVLYSEDEDFEATVKADEVSVDSIIKLKDSGLFEGDCMVTASSSGLVRFTFKVNKHLRSGTATMD